MEHQKDVMRQEFQQQISLVEKKYIAKMEKQSKQIIQVQSSHNSNQEQMMRHTMSLTTACSTNGQSEQHRTLSGSNGRANGSQKINRNSHGDPIYQAKQNIVEMQEYAMNKMRVKQEESNIGGSQT